MKGEVKYNLEEVGIGVEFLEVAEQERLIITALVDYYLKESGRDVPRVK